MASAHQESWQEGTVVRVESLTPEIRRVEIVVDRPRRVDPGAHVDVLVPIDGIDDRRSYSIVDASPDGAQIALSVFTSPTSRGGAAAMNSLRPGDRIRLTEPVNDFPLRIGASKYLLLAGGVGITAMIGMAERLRQIGAEYQLVYAGRSRTVMAYLDDLDRVHGDRLVVHARDEGTTLSVPAMVAGVDPTTELYMCGPIRLMDAVRRAWADRQLPAANLRMETFGNSGWFDAQEFEVRIPALDLRVTVSSQQTMLEALESAGADMLYDCRKGECGLCEVRVVHVDGDIDHRDVFYSERQRDARSKMCCCVSRVIGQDVGGGVVTIVTS